MSLQFVFSGQWCRQATYILGWQVRPAALGPKVPYCFDWTMLCDRECLGFGRMDFRAKRPVPVWIYILMRHIILKERNANDYSPHFFHPFFLINASIGGLVLNDGFHFNFSLVAVVKVMRRKGQSSFTVLFLALWREWSLSWLRISAENGNVGKIINTRLWIRSWLLKINSYLTCRPFWLSPTQAILIPVSPKFEEYAIKVCVLSFSLLGLSCRIWFYLGKYFLLACFLCEKRETPFHHVRPRASCRLWLLPGLFLFFHTYNGT